jgi:hypothetical protein
LSIVLHRIHAVQSDHPVSLEIDEGEASSGRIAADDDLVAADGKSDGLQAQIELVRPEPGNRLVAGLLPRDRLGRDHCLVGRVLDRFEPHLRAVGKAVGVERAISDRIYVRQ